MEASGLGNHVDAAMEKVKDAVSHSYSPKIMKWPAAEITLLKKLQCMNANILLHVDHTSQYLISSASWLSSPPVVLDYS